MKGEIVDRDKMKKNKQSDHMRVVVHVVEGELESSEDLGSPIVSNIAEKSSRSSDVRVMIR